MPSLLASTGLRARLLLTRLLTRVGFGENAFLVPMAFLIGAVTAAAAVAFHLLIVLIRDRLYVRLVAPEFLYGGGVWLLVAFPAAGGLAVGLFSVYVMRAREGHGVVDVMETVLRSSGHIRPLTAVEKILTSAMTIGSGGSAGAEGPIVQIGAAISSGVGQMFQVSRAHLPVLIGCGTAAGISAIFSSPIGGVLFTLEVILLDFSLRTFTPVVLASVIAYVSTQGILHAAGAGHAAIFSTETMAAAGRSTLDWHGVPGIVLLGVCCGAAGASLTRMMYWSEEAFRRVRLPRAVRPAVGGAMLGLLGVLYVVVFGWLFLGRSKPFSFGHYPMPAFFGDGYGVVAELIGTDVYADLPLGRLALLLLFLCLAKIIGTCLTLSSGGSGGVIAPSLFLGATTGALLGLGLKHLGYAGGLEPGYYALIGMGAVLAAVVHAPLASILILFEVTREENTILSAMLACVTATGVARMMFRDSIYTLGLRRRGVRIGGGSDLNLLGRLTVEQVALEPVTAIPVDMSMEELVQRTVDMGARDFVAVDRSGSYAGMLVADDVQTALVEREALSLLLVGELVRPELPCVRNTDDLASVLETFTKYEIGRLPVSLASRPGHVIGLISRRALMRRYHEALQG